MNLELAHDLLAKQIFQRLSAEEKAMRKAERLLRDGYELDEDLRKEDKRRLLSGEDIAFIKPYLPTLQIPIEFQAYFQESEEILRAAEEAEKKELKKRLERQRYLLIVGAIAVIAILVLLFFSIKGNIDLNEQIFENELARAMQFRQVEQYDSALIYYQKAEAFTNTDEQVKKVKDLAQRTQDIQQAFQTYQEHMSKAASLIQEANFKAAIIYYEKAIASGYPEYAEASSQKEITEKNLDIAFNRYKKRGLALYDVGEKSKACEWLEKAYRLKANDQQVNQKRKACI